MLSIARRRPSRHRRFMGHRQLSTAPRSIGGRAVAVPRLHASWLGSTHRLARLRAWVVAPPCIGRRASMHRVAAADCIHGYASGADAYPCIQSVRTPIASEPANGGAVRAARVQIRRTLCSTVQIARRTPSFDGAHRAPRPSLDGAPSTMPHRGLSIRFHSLKTLPKHVENMARRAHGRLLEAVQQGE